MLSNRYIYLCHQLYAALQLCRVQMQWLALIICLYIGVASARTEEDQQTSNVGGVSNCLSRQCFYRHPIDCPTSDSNKCLCKRITLANVPEGNAALCCNTDQQSLEDGLSCIGENCDARKKLLLLIYPTEYICYFKHFRYYLRISTFKHKLYTHT